LKIYSKIKKNYTDGGIAQVLRRGTSKALYLLYHTNNAYWFRMNLQEEIESSPPDGHVSVDLDSPEETIRYIQTHGYYYPEEINTGTRMGHLYASLKYNGRIIGYNKTGFRDVYIEDFKKVYRFPDGIAFTYDTYVDPEYRNRNYGAFLLGRVCSHLKEKGFRSIWAHIPPWNKASESMHRKLGFRKYEFIAYHWIAGIAWTTTDPVELIRRTEDRLTVA